MNVPANDRGHEPKAVLAALDADVAALGILETALSIGEMTDARVEAVHVDDGQAEILEALTRSVDVVLQHRADPVASTLIDALGEPGVLAMVIGAGFTREGHHPVGPTARRVLEHAAKPVVVVPGNAITHQKVRRLLVLLEGTEASSRPVLDSLCPLLTPGVELIVLHVFTDRTLPRMLDQPWRDFELLGREFLATHCPLAARIELRTGPIPIRVTEACELHEIDVVVLSWSQDTTEGRARVVREVLALSALPVLLLPVELHARARRSEGAVRARPEPRREAARPRTQLHAE